MHNYRKKKPNENDRPNRVIEEAKHKIIYEFIVNKKQKMIFKFEIVRVWTGNWIHFDFINFDCEFISLFLSLSKMQTKNVEDQKNLSK